MSSAALFLRHLAVLAAALVAALGFSLLALAWSGPPASPPGGNPELITVGASDQAKAGNLVVQVLVADRICIYDKCLTAWPEF